MEEITDKLKNNRKKFQLTVEQVASETKVRSSVISALEKNEMDSLPAPYIQSFIKTLNEFYLKIENDSDYLKRVKSAKNSSTVKNKTVVASQKLNSIQNKKLDTVEENFSNKKNKIVIDETAKNINETFSEKPQIKNIFTAKEIKFENSKKNIDETNYNENEGFTVKENSFNDIKNNDINNKIHEPKNVENFTEAKKTSNKKTIFKKNKTIKQKSSKQKRYFANSLNISGRDLFIYSFLFAFLGGVIFFIFFYKENMFANFLNNFRSEKIVLNSEDEEENSDSIPVISASRNQLINYFEPIDSIVLRAKCIDTAWVKVEIDSRTTDEMLMLPGMENRWAAWEKIVLSSSNVGGIIFSKNDTVLPMLGAAKTMVKNIVITRAGIANATPLTTSSLPVSANELNPNQVRINPSETDTAKIIRAKAPPKRRRPDTVKPPPVIEFSQPAATRPEILE